MTDRHYRIRAMTRPEFDLAIEWAAQEGWNPGLQDADCYFATDPDGFLMGFLDEEPIACISVVRYDDRFGFLGFYIVRPEYRGQGYGLRIWNAGLAHLSGLDMGLDGVVDQQDNYRKSGFALAYRNIRYAGTTGGTAPSDPRIVPLDRLPFEQVDAYEQPFFPARRAAFTRDWISQPQTRARGLLQDGRLAGYGVIRPCRSGYKIGPLQADSPEQAEALFHALQASVPAAEPVFLDVPESNPAAVALAERHGMTPAFETARMYSGACPELPLERIFGVTSFEIG